MKVRSLKSMDVQSHDQNDGVDGRHLASQNPRGAQCFAEDQDAVQAFKSTGSSKCGAFRVSRGPGLQQQAVQDDGSTMPAPQT